MRNILVNEICKEKPNASAFGAFNKAVQQTNKVIKNGNTDGQTRAQILAYFKVPSKERQKRSIEAFNKQISLPKRKYN